MTQTISPLRQRMIEDMRLRNFTEGTQKTYVRAVANYSRYHGRSPDQLTYDDVRDYQLHLVARGLKASSISQIICALRFLYGTTLGMKDASEQIPLPRVDDPLPVIVSQKDIARFLAHAPNLKMRALFTTVYAAGLRVSEVVGLVVGDIDLAVTHCRHSSPLPQLIIQVGFTLHSRRSGPLPPARPPARAPAPGAADGR